MSLIILSGFFALALLTFLVAPLITFTTREEREEAGVML